MHLESVLVKECVNGERTAQHRLYTLYASKMYALCMRYAGNEHDAQDFFQEGFLKVFKNLHIYNGEGSLEGWIRRSFVHSCIDQLRKKDTKLTYNDVEDLIVEDKELQGYDKIAMKDLLKVIQELPDRYRTIVNLYMVEGLNHREVSRLINISEQASKSQLFRSKAMLQEKILSLNK